MGIKEEILRRRTFAIISHPDAGKTTLTEKFLLYGGAVQLAGSVTARKNQRQSTSDWMELERKRGISISSTVLQFDYNGYRVNLLDTPGHQDFSEDTYRVLTAVDAVVMVIDAAKGIEKQTRKLFEVCRRRGIPIFTFMNKLDRPTKDPLELLDELEHVLGIQAHVMNFPLGTGFEFRGVFDRQEKRVHFFELTSGGAYKAPVTISDLSDPVVKDRLDDKTYAKLVEELEILDHAGSLFDVKAVREGKLTPVFFGSARNNFGVQLLLDRFLKYAGPPQPRMSNRTAVPLEHEKFSGFIFKIQANMDPRHRDRIAFVRVCSGKFERDMTVTHQRTGKKVRLSNASKLFGQSRETINEAYPGDIVGFVGQQNFGIGDTVTEDDEIIYNEIPHFPPEVFAMLQNPNPANFKKFREGLDQLLQEGVVQGLQRTNAAQRVPILAAVGPLQFEVVQYRLESEYGAESRLEQTEWKLLQWIDPAIHRELITENILPTGAALVQNGDDQLGILFTGDWGLNYFQEKNPSIGLSELPFTNGQSNGEWPEVT
ncbi:MAG: peptide chain release factor 3 [Ignavibacteriae bacterium]|nr:peptide chain release factor 3 [Ignavibacteria bacterium]MBI3365356.1 peptide chain release factor 3 [Ignavibacteriota bacterium]